MLILGIESSCDETAASVVRSGREMLSNVIDSQIEIHRKYGGVVPEIAGRNHILAIGGVVDAALKEAGVTFEEIDAVAVTYGAGLVGALLVGVSYAKALCYASGKPLIAVSHIEGHIAANYISHPSLTPPYLCLIVSGGHTAIVDVTDYTEHTLIGSTQDDAAGEAFDKAARVMGLCYPGGVEIDRRAKRGSPIISFPEPLKGENNFNFSYSGLKTAVINYVHTLRQRGETINVEDLAASFQKAAIDPLVTKTVRAAKKLRRDKIVIAGGVAANSYLRASFDRVKNEEDLSVFYPRMELCTDNGAMIASCGYFNYKSGKGISGADLNAVSNVPL